MKSRMQKTARCLSQGRHWLYDPLWLLLLFLSLRVWQLMRCCSQGYLLNPHDLNLWHRKLKKTFWAFDSLPNNQNQELLLFSHKVMSDFFVIPWTIAHQAPLSMRFPRQEYWSELPFKDLPNPGIKPTSPALADRFFSTESPGKPLKPRVLSLYIKCIHIKDWL